MAVLAELVPRQLLSRPAPCGLQRRPSKDPQGGSHKPRQQAALVLGQEASSTHMLHQQLKQGQQLELELELELELGQQHQQHQHQQHQHQQ